MVFSSTIFIFLFLPLVIIAYYLLEKKLRNIVLLLASLIFYAWGEPKYVVVMLFSITINYTFGLLVHRSSSAKGKKFNLILAVIANIGLLVFFKYSNFIVSNVNSLIKLIGLDFSIYLKHMHLPIGISFFTFQGLSYVIDVYRKDAKVQKNIFNLALYISLFPQLIAGPIVRYHDIAEEIGHREVNVNDVSKGLRRFIVGFGKKVIIANTLGQIADQIFAIPTGQLVTDVAWLGAICYTLQIYYDFSGYSDMAMGLGRVFGFTFLENFNYPYISMSIREFWKRWHISLTTWFKDYMYIPMGGSRVSKFKAYRNQFLVFLVSGLWHGASWNFVFWGVYHGFFVTIEKTAVEKLLNKVWKPVRHLYAIIIVIIGWVFFRSENLSYALTYVKTMFGINSSISSKLYYSSLYLNNKTVIVLLLGMLFSTPVIIKLREHLWISKYKSIFACFRDIVLLLIFIICLMSLASSTYNPFIYFRF